MQFLFLIHVYNFLNHIFSSFSTEAGICCQLVNLYASVPTKLWSGLYRNGYLLINCLHNKGTVSRDFLYPVFSLTSSYLSLYRCPRAVLIFSDFPQSYWGFKMTPPCPKHPGVDPKFLG